MKFFFNPLLTIFLFFISVLSLQAQNCSCEDSFENAVDAYEKNYSLFIYKVTEDNRDLYNAHTSLMRAKAMRAEDLQACRVIIEKWLGFFRDGHTYILPSAEEKKETYTESIEITESKYKADYQKGSFQHNPLLGIWKRGSFTVGIMPSPENSNRERDYVGVMLEPGTSGWKAGEVKFEVSDDFDHSYQINYVMNDRSVKKVSGRQTDRAKLEIDGTGEWVKLWPEVENIRNKSEVELKYKDFHLTYIDDIPYLRLPDFYSVDRKHVDSIMRSHHDRIIQSDIMIVDVRGNDGGNDGVYFPVLPYVLSGPVEMPINGFWLSEYNSEMLIGAIAASKGFSVEEFAEQRKEEYKGFISNKGTAYFEHPEDSWTFNADTIYSGPKKVIILADRETASSGETFVYRVNQSDKVVVYGQNTAGVVDGFNGIPQNIGCFEVVFPSSYRAKDIKENPIDPYGIAPDVFVNEKEDVLNYAIEHMRHLIKNELEQ